MNMLLLVEAGGTRTCSFIQQSILEGFCQLLFTWFLIQPRQLKPPKHTWQPCKCAFYLCPQTCIKCNQQCESFFFYIMNLLIYEYLFKKLILHFNTSLKNKVIYQCHKILKSTFKSNIQVNVNSQINSQNQSKLQEYFPRVLYIT